MTNHRDPRISALIVELAESSPPAPSYAELERLLDKPGEGGPVMRGGFDDKQRRPHRLPGWVYGIAAALAVLILIGGMAWLLGEPNEPPVITEPSPTTTEPSPTTTSVPPSQTQGASWVSYQFDPNQHPDIETPWGSIVSTDTGFLGLNADHDLLESVDGIAWTAKPLPFDAAGPVSLERDSSGDYWLVDLGGQTSPAIWRSSDGEVWNDVDTSAIGPPTPNGIQRGSVLPGSLVGAADWVSPAVVSDGENALTTWRLETDRVFLSAAGGPFEEVVVPWGTRSGIRVEDPFVEVDTNLAASENGFIAYRAVIDENSEGEFGVSSAVEAWVSEDGRTWVQGETPTFARDQVIVGMTAVLEREGVFLVGVFGLESGQELWRSEDGLEWIRVAEADGASVSAGESFWLMSRRLGDLEHFVLALWVSSDGVTWRELDLESADPLTDPAGGHDAVIAGDVIFVVDRPVGSDPLGERAMWVGRLDE